MTAGDGAFSFTTMERGRYSMQVIKAGFASANGSLNVPQTNPLTIRMRQSTSRRIRVRLMETVHGDARPFTGPARVLIQSGSRRQLAAMNGRSESIFTLPSDNVTVMVTIPAAQRISPSRANVRLDTSRDRLQTVTFIIYTAVTISNPDPQILGFVCPRINLLLTYFNGGELNNTCTAFDLGRFMELTAYKRLAAGVYRVAGTRLNDAGTAEKVVLTIEAANIFIDDRKVTSSDFKDPYFSSTSEVAEE